MQEPQPPGVQERKLYPENVMRAFAQVQETKVTRRFWLWPNLTNLDAPIIAVIWQRFVADSLQVALPWIASVELFLCVWIIYTSDRLLDVYRKPGTHNTARHQFHMRHRGALTALLIAAVIVTALIGWKELIPATLLGGLLLAGFVGCYLLFTHPLGNYLPAQGFKEASVGILFSAGSLLTVWTHYSGPPRVLFLCGLLLAGVCALNCYLIEAWERRPQLAGKRLSLLCSALLGLIVLVSLTVLTTSPDAHSVIAALGISTLLLLLLTYIEPQMPTEALRVAADAALLTPVFFWFASS